MIVKCINCNKFFDDQFRNTSCPHDTFSANDGRNNFKHYPESWLETFEPDVTYEFWLEQNKVKVNE